MRLLSLLGAVLALAAVLLAVLWPSATGACPYLAAPSWRGLSSVLPRGVSSALGLLPPALRELLPRPLLAPPDARYGADGVRLFTRAELARHDGSDAALPLLLAIRGDVFDVTVKGHQFYAKGSGYNVFTGRDCTRALTLGSLAAENVARGEDVSDFDEAQRAALVEQHKFYADKYPLAGRLIPLAEDDTAPVMVAALAAAAERLRAASAQ